MGARDLERAPSMVLFGHNLRAAVRCERTAANEWFAMQPTLLEISDDLSVDVKAERKRK
jgi:hypothetical protein